MSAGQRFERALEFVLRWEGGYVNHPADPGGATNRGITQVTYDQWRARQNLPARSVQELTDEEMYSIYRARYWERGCCGELPEQIGLVHFDGCVNHGRQNAAKILQRTLKVADDGAVGSATLAAAASVDDKATALALVERRREFYRDIVASKPSSRVFLKGWMNRMDALQAELEKA